MSRDLLLQTLYLALLTLSSIQGAKLYYEFDVSYISGSPDGVQTKRILGINGHFPGPTIQATVGDFLQVKLINNIQDGQNTSIHWHGLHHRGSPFEDGTNGITQCPLMAGQVQLISFRLEQTGTYWYHGHVMSQYTEGLWGALIVKNYLEVHDYDEEIVLTLSDWYHQSAVDNEAWHMSARSRGAPPYPSSGLLNGRGRYPCNVAALTSLKCEEDQQNRHVFTVRPRKKYRVRVINVSGLATYAFSIDNHTLRAIEADGVDLLRPVPVDEATIAPAQRYSFLIETDRPVKDEDFLIRAEIRTDLIRYNEGENINPYPAALIPAVTAVLRYHDGPSIGHYTEALDWKAPVPASTKESPLVLNQDWLQPHDRLGAPSYFDREIVLVSTLASDRHGVKHGLFNSTKFRLPEEPVLMSIVRGKPVRDSKLILYVSYGDVVQIVFNNPYPGPHPFHLHGHSFWVLGTGLEGDGDYVPGGHRLIRNGVRRDTVFVMERSWGVVRFVADNPGAWFLHCHIVWHSVSGMAATIIEAPDLCRKRLTVSDGTARTCAQHGIFV